MCGIFGLWQFGDNSVDANVVREATTRLRHRGPDDEGYLFVNTRTNCKMLYGGRDTRLELNLLPIEESGNHIYDFAFGFRRLSILDLSPAGHQPMASPDKRCWIIFNGEVYNYIELRAELSKCGYQFHTGTDTEIILAAYRHWGVDCLSHFNGMWAFAIWDDKKRHLFLARDRFGIKPLYYVKNADRLIFASEIKSLLALSSVNRRANPTRLYEYLRYGLTDYGDETLFEGVRQIPAAHYLIVSVDYPQDSAPKRYWQITFDRELKLSFEDASNHLRDLFLESVKLHLRSDVKVGAALSGGIDSSAIVASMRALEPQLDLHTFSYTAEDPTVSEEQWVDIVGRTSRAKVHKVQPTPEELVVDLDALIETQDEPFGSTSIYAQSRVFRLAHERGIKVMLDGQGADEMLGGYRMYLAMRLASLLRRLRFIKANMFLKDVSTLPGNQSLSGLNLIASAGGVLLPKRFQLVRKFFKRSLDKRNGIHVDWLDESWFLRQGVVPRSQTKPHSRYMLQEQLYETISESSLPMLLRYEDRNSMAHSIESRVPFLTSDLVEFILALPEEYIIAPDGTSKSVFRHAMRGIAPDPILDRRDKIGFATPEMSWMSTLRPWVETVLASDTASEIPGLKVDVIRQQWKSMLDGQQPFDFKLWRWLNIIRWSQKFEVSF
ncbi:MAG: asparagine synthase (glutamine-hydrolyzing) [Pyrinomonadaceae bacterium]